MRIRWTSPAARQLRAIEAYLLDHDLGAAARIVGRIGQAAARLEDFPYRGRPTGERDVRELVIPRTRYILIYQLRADEVLILALYHERQQRPPPSPKDRR